MKLSEINRTGENYIYGWLFFNNKSRPHTCLIQEKDTELILIIPFNTDEQDIVNWFDWDESSFSGLSLNRDKMPNHFWIKDIFNLKQYSVCDFIVRGRRINIGSGYGSIRLELTSVVCDTSFYYAEMSKIISSSPEYLYWTGLRSLSMETSYNSDSGSPESFKAELKNEEKIPFKIANVELSLTPDWSTYSAGEDNKTVAVTDEVLFESSIAGGASYDSLIVFHEQFRNLLCILAWRKIGYKEILIVNYEDVVTDLSGEKRAAVPRRLITSRHDRWESADNSDSFLFYFDDIGIKGLRRWFLLWEEYQRALMTLSYVARNHSVLAVETQIIELAISIEEIAKPLSRELKKKEPHKFVEKIKLVVESLSREYLGLLPSGSGLMMQNISNTYHSLKHTKEKRDERKRTEWLEQSNLLYCLFGCRLVLLAWISCKLGCPAEKFSSAIKKDSRLNAVKEWWDEK